MLGSISKQLFGHRNTLYEYFNTNFIDKEVGAKRFEFVSAFVHNVETIVAVHGRYVSGSKEDIVSQRLELLKQYPKHTLKVFPSDLTPDMLKFFESEYDFLFLERRDKVEQFLSYCSILHTQKTHHLATEQGSIGEFPFRPDKVSWFARQLQQYADIRDTHKGITIYYEDFMSLGGSQRALAILLGLADAAFDDCFLKTKPTPYEDTYEHLISNQSEWQTHKQYVVDTLSKFN